MNTHALKILVGSQKPKKYLIIRLTILLLLALFTNTGTAQNAQFFRISGPAATTITAFRPDGTLVWSNALAGTNYTVQTVASLPGGTNWVDYVQLPVTGSINTNLIFSFNPPAGIALIPAGAFTMGDTLDGGVPYYDNYPTNVYVSAFYMDVNLVSYSQWQSIYSYATNHGYGFVDAGAGKAANQPVVDLDWYDRVKWCNARSQQAGLIPAYYTDAGLTQVYTNGEVDISNTNVNWSANGYRLPTEAEWEKAARGGLSGQRFPWGNTISESQANYKSDYPNYSYDLGPNGYNAAFTNGFVFPLTSPVGYFAPNGYGLYDMAGNADALCWDWYAARPYPAGSPYLGGTDPHGPSSGSSRVYRGGDFAGPANYLRCAIRGGQSPSTGYYDGIGFRCVRGQ